MRDENTCKKSKNKLLKGTKLSINTRGWTSCCGVCER